MWARTFESSLMGTTPSAMIVFAPAPGQVSAGETLRLFRETFRRQVERLEQGSAVYRVGASARRYERLPGMAYHFKPEMFIQLSGATDFALPDRRFTLGPGEICVMPRGVPHGEVARDEGRPFENVVVCYYNETVAIHVACATPARKPAVHDIFFFRTSLYSDLVEYLNRIGELRVRDPSAAAAATRGMLLAEMALLLTVVNEAETERYTESDRVFRCQWLIRNNIDEPDMGLEVLAELLHCSPEHLSRVFHKETGERVVEYISRVRLENAFEAMRNTDLSVKEIAVACGFNDPSYFSRVFRKAAGCAPHEYRDQLRHLSCKVEREPKVVYFDREEKDFGLQPEVMAKAGVRTLS